MASSCGQRVIRNIKVSILTLLFLLIFPLILLLFLPIYIWRTIIGKLNTIVNPEEGKILSTKSAVFASDDIYGKPRCSLLVLFLFQGKLNLEEMQSTLLTDMVHKKNSTGVYLYQELRQYISNWMGFYFWRWDKDFKIQNHVLQYDGKLKDQICDEEKLPLIVNELTTKPFNRGQSPWEIIRVSKVNIQTTKEFYVIKDPHENNSREQSICIFRLHHSLADGISIQKLLLDVAGYNNNSENGREGKKKRENNGPNFGDIFNFILRAPFETIGALVDCHDTNEWHLPEKLLAGELSSAASIPVQVDFIKDIKNSFDGVTFAGVVLAAAAGGIRSFMIDRNIRVPKVIHVLTPLPMPGHSSKLRNHLTAAAIGLPLGEATASQRLKIVAQNLKNLKKSVVPQANYCFYPVMGGLFPFMAKRMFRHTFTTALLSSFEGPRNQIRFLGHDVDDIIFAGGLLMGNIGVGMTLLSYQGFFRIVLGVDKAILPEFRDAQEIVERIHKELYVLRDLNSIV